MVLKTTYFFKNITQNIQIFKIIFFIFFITFSSIETTYAASITITSNVVYNPAIHAGNDITIGSNGTFTINSDAFLNSIKVNNGGTLIVNAPYTLTVGIISNSASTLIVDFQNGSIVTLNSGASLVVYGLLNNSNNSVGITLNGTVTVYGNVTGGNGSQIVGSGSILATGTIITSGSGSIFGSQYDCLEKPCNINQVCGFLPSIPTASVTLQPTCLSPTGTVVITAPIGAGYEYQLDTGLFQSNTTFEGVTPGNHTLRARLESSPNCISLPLTISVNAAPIVPATPTVTVVDNCNGTSTLSASGYTGSLSWNTGATTSTITVSAAGTYTVTQTVSGCISAAGSGVAAPKTQPGPPQVGSITQPSCFLASGSVTLNGLPASGNWTINPGNISGSGTSTIISGLTSGTYNFTVTNAAGCTSVASSNIVINTQPTINTWQGLNNNWNDHLNWSCGAPTTGSDILIPNGLSNYPTLTDNSSLKNVEIQLGAQLIVNNNGLTITGVLTLNGEIDLQNESQLIQTNGSSFSGNGTIEIDQQGTYNNFYFNYWSSPVNNNGKYTVASVLRDASFPSNIKNIDFGAAFTYADKKATITLGGAPIKISTYWINKFTNKPAGSYSSWTYIGKDGELKPGEGYTMKGSNRNDFQDQNYTFIGTPNNGTINLTVDNGMQYLIGNPYPSAMDANKFIDDNSGSIDGTLYFWDHVNKGAIDSHYLADYDIGYAIYTKSGGAAAGGNVGGIQPPGRKVPKRYIAVAQGFFVNGIKTNGQILFNNNQRDCKKEDSENSQFIRTSGKKTNNTTETDTTPRIYFNYYSPLNYYRQLLVALLPNTTNGVDYGYDARNIDQFKEDLYWKVANNNFVIQAVPTFENKVLPIEVKVASKGSVKISIDRLENISDETAILLKDRETGLLYNLRTDAFKLDLDPGTYSNRFEIILKLQQNSESEEETLVKNDVDIFLNQTNAVVYIKNTQGLEIKEISIHNMIGQQLQFKNQHHDKNLIEIPFLFESGVYVITVKTNLGTTNKKILNY